MPNLIDKLQINGIDVYDENANLKKGGFLKVAVVAGGAAGDFTVTGISTTDQLVSVLYFTGAGTDITDLSDLTGEFSISAADTINNTGGTATTGGKLVVIYFDLTP